MLLDSYHLFFTISLTNFYRHHSQGNANDDCYPQEKTRVEEWGLNYGTYAAVLSAGFVALCGAVVLSVYLFSKRKHTGNAVSRSTERRIEEDDLNTNTNTSTERMREEDEKDALTLRREEDEKYALNRIGKDSVYSYFITPKRRGWVVAFGTVVVQVALLVFFVITSEANLQDGKTRIKFTWKCPRDSDTCDNKSRLNYAGWVIFSFLMIVRLSKDMINSVHLMYYSSKVRHTTWRRIRYFISGVCLCWLTLFALYVSCCNAFCSMLSFFPWIDLKSALTFFYFVGLSLLRLAQCTTRRLHRATPISF